jgi:2-methylisocitrate lyase-like PEP mutase family enzyme
VTSDADDRAERFLAAHRPGRPLLMPNAWDAGVARAFEAEGFEAIATTSSGHAATLGRRDGRVSRDEALAHAAALVSAVSIPVSADLEDGFGADPEDVAETVRLARATGLAGCSVEDAVRRDGVRAVRRFDEAVARVAAAAEAAHDGPGPFVLTARAENHLYGVDDLDDTIARLTAFEEAGADILFAPGVNEAADIARLVGAVRCPVNVLVSAATPTVAELADLGVARISVGGGLHLVALAAAVEAVRDLRGGGPHEFWPQVAAGRVVRDGSVRG